MFIKTAIISTLAAYVSAAYVDNLIFTASDCTGTVAAFTRTSIGSATCTASTACTLYQKTACPATFGDVLPAGTSGTYLITQQFNSTSTTCDASKAIAATGTLADGTCQKSGSGSTKISCVPGGAITVTTCTDTACGTCAAATAYTDGECKNSMKFTCAASGKGLLDSTSGADAMPIAKMLTAAATLLTAYLVI